MGKKRRKPRKRTNANVPAKGRLKDIADQLWSVAVRDDWNWKCCVCSRRACEAHHLIPRTNQATRYELANGIALCSHHHQFNSEMAPHQNAAGWLLWLKSHEPRAYRWYTETVESGGHRRFTGTTNADYYCTVIRGFQEYVPEDDFERIVGIRFARWLKENE